MRRRKMPSKESVFSEEAVLEAINNQIENNDPPETKQTYDRLMKEIQNHDEVMDYLGVVMKSEILDILKSKKPFNRKRYVERLNRLPDVSWAE
jgi:vacuolar-type H+-ATPase catalytic subunit A/Vma1